MSQESNGTPEGGSPQPPPLPVDVSNGAMDNSDTQVQGGDVNNAPSNGNRAIARSPGSRSPMSPRAKELWMRFIKVIVSRYRIQRMLDFFRKSDKNDGRVPCFRCTSMKLTEAKFMISEYRQHRRDNREFARTAPTGRLSAGDPLGPEGLGFGPCEFNLGTLQELFDRRDECPLCGLAVSSLYPQYKTFRDGHRVRSRTEAEFYKPNITCFVSWQIDGRKLIRNGNGRIVGDRPCTRRLRLRWEIKQPYDLDKLYETYIILVAPRNGGSNLFLGRSPHNFETDTTGVALIRRWIKYCDTTHGDMCKSQTLGVRPSKSYFGVIDLHEMCLTKLPENQRYVALSYTWGQDGHYFKTTTHNVRELLKRGGLRRMEELMPRTIRDTITLVKDLGERYLWVDSICIIQGNDRSWALNSRIMDKVYGNAYLTVCAADGDGASSGLQKMNAERGSAERDSRAQYNRELRLMSTQPAENYIRTSAWNTRGWTFQERLLSPRNLIFTAGRMYFQCKCTARTTDIISEDDDAGWSIEFKDSPLLMLQKLPTRPLYVYKQALELYMTRHLTNTKDILAAFTGMGNLVCNALGGNLVYGLPSSHFDWALLWEPRDAAIPRPSEAGDGGEKFPSWSWCGWKDQVMEYKEEMLVGCEDNLHDWLMNHTWIIWYIRDWNGNLRPVWSGDSKTASNQADPTWKGYSYPSYFNRRTYDKYGRFVGDHEQERENRIANAEKFELILDICPFGVDITKETDLDTDERSSSTERDMPFLQFKTWSAFFRIEPGSQDCSSGSEDGNGPPMNEKIFRRYSILDYKDDWCGTILLDKFWGGPGGLEDKVFARDLNIPLEFIALSDAKQFGEGEYDAWANYIPMTRKESSWDLYYVLLIETKNDISTRVGLGKVFKEAFENSCKPEGKQWKEFILG